MGPLYYLSHIRSSACGANATGASEGVGGAQTAAVFGPLWGNLVATILDSMLTLLTWICACLVRVMFRTIRYSMYCTWCFSLSALRTMMTLITFNGVATELPFYMAFLQGKGDTFPLPPSMELESLIVGFTFLWGFMELVR
jgi:hypothetical protein